MIRLLVCILWFIAIVHTSDAQENEDLKDLEREKEWTVMALSRRSAS